MRKWFFYHVVLQVFFYDFMDFLTDHQAIKEYGRDFISLVEVKNGRVNGRSRVSGNKRATRKAK
jgi:hypothetical protein